MNYDETIDYLYKQLPMFERQGSAGYKPGLGTSMALDDTFGNPHRHYKCIHVAGTNGKGSVSHLLATTLQQAGYKVGLYTSPHIVDFRERIRVDGNMIPREAVVDFMQRYFDSHFQGRPSFFELTSTMAFDYFRQCKVDLAVIEVGLGGRLDSTNIINPVLSVITNISLDHTQFLGDTLAQIAGEKAGIIKHGTPVVVGEAEGEVRKVFQDRARNMQAPITFAQDHPIVTAGHSDDGRLQLDTAMGPITDELGGIYQVRNANTVLHCIEALRQQGFDISDEATRWAFGHVEELSGLIGRWQTLQHKPKVVCDSGHNLGAFGYIVEQLHQEHYHHLHMVLGFMHDKDIDDILDMLPREATYYYCNAQSPRALPAQALKEKAAAHQLAGNSYPTAQAAYKAALQAARHDDFVYVGGSMYVLAEILGQAKAQ